MQCTSVEKHTKKLYSCDKQERRFIIGISSIIMSINLSNSSSHSGVRYVEVNKEQGDFLNQTGATFALLVPMRTLVIVIYWLCLNAYTLHL